MLVITGIEAGADPGDGRHHSAGRAGRMRATTAAAQIAIYRAVSPIIARCRITGIVGWIFRAHAGDRQKRKGCNPDKRRADTGDDTPPRRLAGRIPRGFFEQSVKPVHQ